MNAPAAQAAPKTRGGPGTHMLAVELVPGLNPGFIAPVVQCAKVAAVIFAGMRGKASLELEVIDEPVDPALFSAVHEPQP